jgi:hypothetical protein
MEDMLVTHASKKVVLTLAGLAYGLSLAWFGWIATGAGHGTFFFFSVAVFPYGIGLILWPLIGYLLADIHTSWRRIQFLTVIIVRYGLLTLYVVLYGPSEMPRIEITWRYSALYVLAPIVLFLVGQGIIWACFFVVFFDGAVTSKQPEDTTP